MLMRIVAKNNLSFFKIFQFFSVIAFIFFIFCASYFPDRIVGNTTYLQFIIIALQMTDYIGHLRKHS